MEPKAASLNSHGGVVGRQPVTHARTHARMHKAAGATIIGGGRFLEATAVPVVSPADMSRVRAAAAQEKRPIKVAESESCVSRVSWRLQPSVHPCTKAKEGRRTEAGRCDLAPTLYQCIHSSGCWPHICLVPLKRGFFFSGSGRIKVVFFLVKSSVQPRFYF